MGHNGVHYPPVRCHECDGGDDPGPCCLCWGRTMVSASPAEREERLRSVVTQGLLPVLIALNDAWPRLDTRLSRSLRDLGLVGLPYRVAGLTMRG